MDEFYEIGDIWRKDRIDPDSGKQIFIRINREIESFVKHKVAQSRLEAIEEIEKRMESYIGFEFTPLGDKRIIYYDSFQKELAKMKGARK